MIPEKELLDWKEFYLKNPKDNTCALRLLNDCLSYRKVLKFYADEGNYDLGQVAMGKKAKEALGQ